MLPALEHIIHRDQRGFMKDRRISVNIRKMLDIIHQANSEDLEAVVMSLDFVKCFDKCSYSILHGSLEFFGFGMVVKQWTKILYDDYTVRIQNNGHFSDKIHIKKGVHQGGCCSSIYFLVIAEILALSLRSNQQIEGITLRDIRNLLNQFADDMDIFSMCTETSIKAIHQELEHFRKQSGFTVSYDKTTIYRIGSLRHSNAQMYDMDELAWSNQDINVLGVTVAHEDIINKNYSTILQKAKSNLNAWNNRGLSLIGKVQVVNTLIASLFGYKMMVLPFMPKDLLKSMDNMIREFIWNNKKAKIAYSILQNPKCAGGLGLVNLRAKDISLKATWPQVLAKEEEYSEMVYNIMRCTTIKEDIWRCRLLPDDVCMLKIKNQFWADVLVSWCEFNYNYQYKTESELLWYNSTVRIQNKPFFWKDIYNSGLIFIHQLFSNKKFKSQEQVWEEYKLSELRYNSLKAAIPTVTKTYFLEHEKQQYMPLPPHTYDMCTAQNNFKLSQKVYQYITEDATLCQSKLTKWNEELRDEITQSIYEFGKLHLDIQKLTNVPKFKSFQYRLLQRGLVTNIQLHKWKMIPDNKCTFCKKEPETLVHLFVQCPKIKSLWEQVVSMIKQRYAPTTLRINDTNIITNRIVRQKNSVINFICLITKQFIYRQRCLSQTIHFPVLQGYLNSIENMEKYIAIKNGKLNFHERKWNGGLAPQRQHQENNIEEYVQQYLERG